MSRRRARNRFVEILLTSFLIALFLLIGVAGMLWVVQSGALSGPTPTPTATPGPSLTPTFDFRATRMAEDMLTQVAYSVVLATTAAETLAGLTPSPTATETLTPTATPAPPEIPTVAEALPTSIPITVTATLTNVSLMIPFVAGEISPTLTVTVQTTATTNAGLPPGYVQPTLTVTQAITATATPIPAETPTPQPPTATPTPLPPPTPTPTQGVVVSSLKAVVGGVDAKVYVGPGSVYTPTNPPAVAAGATVNLFNRDAAGEWVYMCCLPGTGTSGWVRSARVVPTENPAPANAPAGADGNDIRLLQVSQALPNTALIRTPTPVAPEDYPLYRRDSSNQGRVPTLPRPPFAINLTTPMRASQPFQSGVVVFGQQVVAASADGHIYSFDRLNGNQRWRYQVGEPVTLTPAVANNVVFAITSSGRVVAIDENGQLRWQQNYGFQPRHSIIAGADNLYVIGRAGASDRLFVLNQSNGTAVRDWPVSEGDTLNAPALGGQMIFLSGNGLWALDAFTLELVWQLTGYEMTTAPVYVTPGAHAAAEIYVADVDGIFYSFDANTGKLLQQTFAEPMATLAVNSRFVVAVGVDGATVRAFDRVGRNQAWAQTLSIGKLVGGPIVDEERILVASDNGALQLLDVTNGGLRPTNVQFEPIAGSLAVSGQYIFASSTSGQILAAHQSP